MVRFPQSARPLRGLLRQLNRCYTRAPGVLPLAGKPYWLDYWGISASDSQHGYTAWGGPGIRDGSAQGFGGIDGSVVPNAAAGSLPFVPGPCLRVLRSVKEG